MTHAPASKRLVRKSSRPVQSKRPFLAINYWTIGGFDGATDPVTAIQLAAEMGYDGLELTFPDAVKESVTQSDCAEIREVARQQGIALRTLASGRYWNVSLSSPERQERSEAIRFTKRYIEVAAWLGVTKVLVIPGHVDVPWDGSRPVTPYADVWLNSTASLKACLKHAEKHKVCLCLENVWNKFLLSPVEFSLFIDQFNSTHIGVYFDVANCVLNGYPEHWISLLNRRIQAVHFKNFQRQDCGGGLHGFGEDMLVGDVDFPKVIEGLKKIHYAGPITAEMLPFSRLPNLNLPDLELARETGRKMRALFCS